MAVGEHGSQCHLGADPATIAIYAHFAPNELRAEWMQEAFFVCDPGGPGRSWHVTRGSPTRLWSRRSWVEFLTHL
jgi:hypothetical protein